MDYLKEGIGLRALAQRDPVVELHAEGHRLFVAMIEATKEECVSALFAAEPAIPREGLRYVVARRCRHLPLRYRTTVRKRRADRCG